MLGAVHHLHVETDQLRWEQLLLTAFTHVLGSPATPALGGVLGSLGGGAPIGRLVLLHLLDHRIFW